jgi:hypothetical protein
MQANDGEEVLAGYVSGPAAATEATAAALARAACRSAVLTVLPATCGCSVPMGPAHGSSGCVTRGRSASSGAVWRRLGFFVCVADLEDELIRAAGPALVAEVFAAHGDLGAFRTIQRQPAWRGRDEAGPAK